MTEKMSGFDPADVAYPYSGEGLPDRLVMRLAKHTTKVDTKWGSSVYDNIGIAHYTHFYYDNLTHFAKAFKDAKMFGVDVSGNLDTFRIVVKTRKTLDDYVMWQTKQSAMKKWKSDREARREEE